MDAPPLTLSVLHLRPSSLLQPVDEDVPVPSTLPPDPIPPSHPLPAFSPTHSYPSPYPDAVLGSNLAISLDLANTRPTGNVMGVRMMCEVQSPNGRYRLGEVVHGAKDPSTGDADEPLSDVLSELAPGESVKLDVEGEMKELGMHVVIVSVAWETLDGRRTFQRFFKFNVNAPLAIKTRIHQATHANTTLDQVKRERVYLEILAQNVSPEGMVFDKVLLEAVNGLLARSVASIASASTTTETADELDQVEEAEGSDETLLPGETRQFLFVLVPTARDPSDDAPGDRRTIAKSTFPPHHQPGTILPLGRLDLTWRSGPAHDPGRLQTSTLNRRIPVSTIPPSRTLSAASPSPAGRTSPRPPVRLEDDLGQGWEFDLVVVDRKPSVEVEKEFDVTLRLGVRTSRAITEDPDCEPVAPTPPILGVQYLVKTPATNHSTGPQFTLSPPSRTSTPMARTGSSSSAVSRPFSPLSQGAAAAAADSRPMTPVSSQLRQATSSHIGSPSTLSAPLLPAPSLSRTAFPPPPTIEPPVIPVRSRAGQDLRGEVRQLGPSLVVVPCGPLAMVEEKSETTYADPIAPLRRWETTFEHALRYIAMDEGLAELGGLRVLLLDDENARSGSTGREWESLGDVWVEG